MGIRSFFGTLNLLRFYTGDPLIYKSTSNTVFSFIFILGAMAIVAGYGYSYWSVLDYQYGCYSDLTSFNTSQYIAYTCKCDSQPIVFNTSFPIAASVSINPPISLSYTACTALNDLQQFLFPNEEVSYGMLLQDLVVLVFKCYDEACVLTSNYWVLSGSLISGTIPKFEGTQFPFPGTLPQGEFNCCGFQETPLAERILNFIGVIGGLIGLWTFVIRVPLMLFKVGKGSREKTEIAMD